MTNLEPKTYVIGDIHGMHLALKQALERSGFRYKIDQLITIGDIVDGGPESYLCIEELLKIPNRIDIRGNHDNWMLEFINTGRHPEQWGQGALQTAKSYADAIGLELKVQEIRVDYFNQIHYTYILNLNPDDITESHKNFFRRQHRYHKDDNKNVFVHGGFDRSIPVSKSPEITMMWDRSLWKKAMSSRSSQTPMKFEEDLNLVFIGHTTTLVWDTDQPIKAGPIWNLDTGGGGGGKITIMDVNTEEYWQSDLVYDLHSNISRR